MFIYMDAFIACCGLDCGVCDARIATVTNNQALKEKTAKLWSNLNHTQITADMIHCTGCRVEGAKTPYCDFICPIRKCAAEKNADTCADCGSFESCERLSTIISGNPQALCNLQKFSSSTH